jgi:hypothetical protein
MPPDATTATDNSPASETQIALAKQLIRQIAQYGDDPAPKIQAKLKAAGLTRLADLTYAEIHKLIQALGVKNLEAFFTASLLGHLKSAAPQGNSGN